MSRRAYRMPAKELAESKTHLQELLDKYGYLHEEEGSDFEATCLLSSAKWNTIKNKRLVMSSNSLLMTWSNCSLL
jgi:hypothetical protein